MIDYLFDAPPRFLPFTFGSGEISFEISRHLLEIPSDGGIFFY